MENNNSKKNLIIGLIVAVIALVGIAAINQSGDEPSNNIENQANNNQVFETADGEYSVVPEQSVVSWQAGKKIGGDHNGLVSVESGDLAINNNQLVSGQVTIDMVSLNNLDLEGDSATKLDDHLKSDDFFAVEAYPNATIKIVSVNQTGNTANVLANMTIRGNTNEIEFPVTLLSDDNDVELVADLEIDRSVFEIGTDSTLAEIGLKDSFDVQVRLVATKQ